MKTGILVSFAALTLLIAIPSAANAAGQKCGGIAGLQCGPGEFCQFKPGTCGRGDQMGVCAPRPQICNERYKPVCGCDNNTYSNDCKREAAGVSKLHNGKCKKAY
jgi:hypothetical protein